jgi:hypothetical protein
VRVPPAPPGWRLSFLVSSDFFSKGLAGSTWILESRYFERRCYIQKIRHFKKQEIGTPGLNNKKHNLNDDACQDNINNRLLADRTRSNLITLPSRQHPPPPHYGCKGLINYLGNRHQRKMLQPANYRTCVAIMGCSHTMSF